MSEQNKHTLQESHSQNPFDQARENQDFQREYDNAQEFYRKRPFVERFKKYIPWVTFLQGLGHTFSALSLGAGGIFTVYNYLFSDSEISDFQTWLFVGIGVVIFVLLVISIEAGKGHFLAAAMKNKFEAANQLLGEKVKPSLRKWAFTLVALSLIGSVFFGMMGTYYLATEKAVIDNSYELSIQDAKEKASQADESTRAHYQKQIESKYSQIEQIKKNIVNSCPSCYTMRQRMQNQINDIQESISTLEQRQRKALKDNASNHAATLADLEASNNSTLDQDSQKAMGRGWILGVLTFFSDLMIVFCAWFIALYNDRLFREGKHIGAISEDRMPQVNLQTIYLNDLYDRQTSLMRQLGGGQLSLNEGRLDRLFLPSNVIVQKPKKKKKKKKKKEAEKVARNPIGFAQNSAAKTDLKIDAQKSGSNVKNSPKFDDSAKNGKGKNTAQNLPQNSPSGSSNSSRNFLMNLNPETPYNLAKKYDMKSHEKKQLNDVRKAYLKFVKKENKRPMLSELATASNKSANTVKKYVEMMEKDGQELLRKRGETM